MTTRAQRRVVTGHYAGPISRALAFGLDAAASSALFTIGSAGLAWFGTAVIGADLTPERSGWVWISLLVAWLFLYHWVGLALVGKTVGMAVVGLRVVMRPGSPLIPRRAALRVLVMPLSFAVMGLGLAGAIVGAERRTLHDVIAGTVVVYDWGERSAELPTFVSAWLDRKSVEP